MNEQELDELLNTNKKEKDFSKRIRNTMRKKIFLSSLVAVLLITLSVVGGYKGSDYFITSSSYNPRKEQKVSNEVDTFELLIKTYYQTFYPGHSINLSFRGQSSLVSKGFGKYTYSFTMQDTFSNNISVGFPNLVLNISPKETSISTISGESNTGLIMRGNDWMPLDTDKDSDSYVHEEKNIEEIKKNPDSSVFYVCISTKKAHTLDELIQFTKKYKTLEPTYLVTDQSDSNGGVCLGVSLFESQLFGLNKESNKKYPHLLIDTELSKDTIKKHYLSTYKFLLDHKDFYDAIIENNTLGPVTSFDFIKKSYNKAKEDKITWFGLQAVVDKETLLQLVKDNDISNISIVDAKFSSYERN